MELGFEIASSLARTLKSIPNFPWDDDNIVATAEDLQRWCKGGMSHGRVWPPEAQARWIVTEAREKWDEWKGTGALRELFNQQFGSASRASNEYHPPAGPPVTECYNCNDTGITGPRGQKYYCDCMMGIWAKEDGGQRWLQKINGTEKPQVSRAAAPPLNQEQIIEQRRRKVIEAHGKLADPQVQGIEREWFEEVIRLYGSNA